MKAAMNGVLNLSILDGWFDEAYAYSGSWAIGGREAYTEDQDDIHASDIYSKLENEIVPAYFEGREEGVPGEWVRRMKQSLAAITPRFGSGRMVEEYSSKLYEPAHRIWMKISGNDFAEARRKTAWDTKLTDAWERVRFVEIGDAPGDQVLSGSPVNVRAMLDLAGLKPSDVRVEAVLGRIGVSGQLESLETVALRPEEQLGEAYVFSTSYVVQQTGRVGYSVRVCQDHFENSLTRPCNPLLKWG
jgi:starch phosphorylase